MQEFTEFEEHFGVVIRSGWIFNDVSLTINPRRKIITYRAGLELPVALLAVVTMIEVLVLGWEGKSFRFRYPLPDDDAVLHQASARNRRDYRIPERHARRRLCPDTMLAQAAREEWEDWQLSEACGLNLDSCRRRVAEWRGGRTGVINLNAWR